MVTPPPRPVTIADEEDDDEHDDAADAFLAARAAVGEIIASTGTELTEKTFCHIPFIVVSNPCMIIRSTMMLGKHRNMQTNTNRMQKQERR